METPLSKPDENRAGLVRRPFRRLFSWRTLRRALIGFVGLITLVALLWTEENWRGRRDWEQYRKEWEAKGERFDFASFAPRAVPDEQNFFMAPIWAGALEYARSQQWDIKRQELRPADTNLVDPLHLSLGRPSDQASPSVGNWTKQTITDLQAWQEYYRKPAGRKPDSRTETNEFPAAHQPQTLAKDVLLALGRFDPAIEALHQAAQRPDARLPLDYTDPSAAVAQLLPLLADFKGISQVLQLRAIAELADGQGAKALDDVELMLRLTDSIRNQPFLISHLVRIAIMNITLEPVYEGLAKHEWTDAQLAALESSLAKMDFLADYEFAMRGERAFGISMLGYLPQYHGLNPFYHQYQLAGARMFQQWILPCVNLETRVVSPATVQRLQSDEAAEWKHTTPYNILAKMEFPAISKVPIKFAFSQASVDLARVACALERYRLAHGEYPDTLDALAPRFIPTLPHDVINGQPLHYRRTDDGQFLLYSVGWNDKDGGGKPGKSLFDEKEGDWVWEYPGKEN